MRSIKQHLLVTLGFGLAGAIGAAFGTGTAQAVVATLVEIVNPTSSPVPTLAVDSGRAPYQRAVDNTGVCSGGSSCTFTFTGVPSGDRLFGTRLSGKVSFNPPAPSIIYVEIDVGGAFNSAFFVAAPFADFSAFNSPVAFVLDSPTSVSVTVTLIGATFPGGALATQVVTLYGEEVNCAAVSCPAIATQ